MTTNATNLLRAVIADLQAKLTRRHADYGIHRAFVALSGASNLEEARHGLAELSARMSDESFEALSQGAAAISVQSLTTALCLSLSPARRVIVDAAWSTLCNRAGFSAKEAAAEGIPAQFLVEQFDVSRFIEVKNGSTTAERALDDFADEFAGEQGVTSDEFVAYCCGVGLVRPDNKAYELHVLRTWNLDRNYAAERAAAERAAASGLPQHRENQGRNHPLYQTTSCKVGAGAVDGAKQAVVKFHRAGRFTKENPQPGPSCSLNTATTRSIV